MAWRWSGRPPEEQSLEPRSLGRGRPRRALGYPQDRWLDTMCQLQGRCKQDSKWQNLRAQNVPAPDN